MKNETTNRNTNENQIRSSINDIASVKLNFIPKSKTAGPLDHNHPTFGEAGGRYCTGPPGRARSPGVFRPVRTVNPDRSGEKTEPFSVLLEHTLKLRPIPEIQLTQNIIQLININIQNFTNIKFYLS